MKQLIGKFGLVSSCIFLFCGTILKEILVHLLRQPDAIPMIDVRVEIRDHAGLCVTSITLHGLDVSTANLELQRGCLLYTSDAADEL